MKPAREGFVRIIVFIEYRTDLVGALSAVPLDWAEVIFVASSRVIAATEAVTRLECVVETEVFEFVGFVAWPEARHYALGGSLDAASLASVTHLCICPYACSHADTNSFVA